MVKVKIKQSAQKKVAKKGSKEKTWLKKGTSSESKLVQKRHDRVKTEVEELPASVLATIRSKINKH